MNPRAAGRKWKRKMTNIQSELTIVTKAKDLCSYIMTVTQKSPKQFRFTFVTRLQNLALDIIECVYRANEIYIGQGVNQALNKAARLDFQHKALTGVKILAYFAELAMTHQCLLAKQYEQIALKSTDCMRLIGAWINSDKNR
jgi:hypothetical protein